MKTIGEIIDQIDKKIADYTAKALNPDRDQYISSRELHRRDELIGLRKFITEEAAK